MDERTTELAMVKFAAGVSYLLGELMQEAQVAVHRWALDGRDQSFPYAQTLRVETQIGRDILIPLPTSWVCREWMQYDPAFKHRVAEKEEVKK